MNRVISQFAPVLALVLLAAAPCGSLAQFDPLGQPGMPRTFENAVRSVEARFEPATVKRGQTVTWKLTVELAPGWHTYPVNKLAKDDKLQQYTPIRAPSAGDVIFVGQVTDPPTHSQTIVGEATVRVLEEKFTWERPAVVSPQATPGKKNIEVSVTLLVCDKDGCLAPKPVKLEAPITISDAEPVSVDAKYLDQLSGGGPFEVVESQTQVANIPAALVFGFLAGLILNVMPCVLPVVSLKIYGFVKQAGEDRRRVQLLGLAFGAGILAVFLILAALAAFAGLGWGQQFQSNTFLVIMVGLVVAFALGMFDIYMIQLPGFVSTAEAAAASQEGVLGSFVKGMMATVLATPCSGPFLGATLSYALIQPPAVIFAIFTMIGVGMAFPYVVLSMNPKWMRFVPKPGEWMNTFKGFMGFLLLGTAAWLLWQRRADGELVFWTVVFCLFVAMGLWLYGRWSEPGASHLKRLLAPFAAAAVIGVGVGFCFLVMYRPAEAAAQSAQLEGWKPYSRAELDRLRAEGKTVIVDWTADW